MSLPRGGGAAGDCMPWFGSARASTPRFRVIEGGAAHLGGLTRRIKIRPKVIPGYAGKLLDIQHAFGRNASLGPPGDTRLVDADFPREIGKTHPPLAKRKTKNVVKVGRGHNRDSCATGNRCQAQKLGTMLTTGDASSATASGMPEAARIHASKQPRRPHYIPEWAKKRHLTQAKLASELGADKSVVSRWFKGTSPGSEWQHKLAVLFKCEPEALFRHPDDDWFRRLFERHSEEEIERIKALIEAAFPDRKRA